MRGKKIAYSDDEEIAAMNAFYDADNLKRFLAVFDLQWDKLFNQQCCPTCCVPVTVSVLSYCLSYAHDV